MEYAIGIDLGTTNSCVGVYKNDKIEIIANNMGNRITPSIVSFKNNKETDMIIGDVSKSQMISNFKNTIYNVKRLIGRNFSDTTVQNDIKLLSYKVENDGNDKPIITINLNNEKKQFYPEQISAFILKRLKLDAEEYVGKEIKDVVITVPAYFNDSQRQSTIDAGKIAGLNVIRTINEPTAAAIAYGIQNKINTEKKVCVFDFGGGTFDISILIIKNNEYNVIATGGDTHLGGEDIDNLLVQFCVKEFKEETNIDISFNKRALTRLKSRCEEIKKQLSNTKEAIIEIDCLAQDKDFNMKLNRNNFNEICKNIFKKCIEILKNTLDETNILKSEINEIILVGGSTRIPKIQEMIKNFFTKEYKLSKAINPDEAVGYGAAIIASLNRKQRKSFVDLVIKDVCPLSLGIEVTDQIMSFIIKKNTPLPCKQTKTFITSENYQEKFGIYVYEGERKFIKNNYFLDHFELNNITKRLKGETEMIVTFEIDNRYSVLKVSAKEKGKNNTKEIKITRKKREEAKLKKMIEEAKMFELEDMEKLKKIRKKKNKVNGCCCVF